MIIVAFCQSLSLTASILMLLRLHYSCASGDDALSSPFGQMACGDWTQGLQISSPKTYIPLPNTPNPWSIPKNSKGTTLKPYIQNHI